MVTDDWEVKKPGDPYDGQVGHLVRYDASVNVDRTGTVRLPDGAERTYMWYELRALIRV